jgi:hypothetical protein
MPPKKTPQKKDVQLDAEPEEDADVYEYPKLYKRDARGTVREYEVRVEVLDDGTVKLYRISRIHETSSGDLGRPVIHMRVVKGKVKRTDLEQAQNMAQKYWSDQKTKKGYVEDPKAEHQSSIHTNIPMTAYIYEPGVTRINYPVILQPKYDGSRTNGVCETMSEGAPLGMPPGSREVRFYSRSRHLVYGMPHISEILQPILCGLPQFNGLVLDGELMNDENRQWESSGLMRRYAENNLSADQLEEYERFVKDTYLVLYDCYFPGQENMPFRERLSLLRELYRQIPSRYHQTVRMAPNKSASNQREITDTFGEHLQEGYEGTMIRNPEGRYHHNRTKDLLKLKGVKDADFLIVDVIPAENEDGSRLVLQTDSGKQFNVRPRGDLEYRQWLLRNRNRIIGLKATIQYATLSEDGIPQHPRVHKEQKKGREYLDLDAQVRDT